MLFAVRRAERAVTIPRVSRSPESPSGPQTHQTRPLVSLSLSFGSAALRAASCTSRLSESLHRHSRGHLEDYRWIDYCGRRSPHTQYISFLPEKRKLDAATDGPDRQAVSVTEAADREAPRAGRPPAADRSVFRPRLTMTCHILGRLHLFTHGTVG